MKITCIIITAAFAVSRFIVPVAGKLNKADIYKDMAHIWVGGLFGAAIASGSWDLWAIAATLTLVEVVAFFARRKT